MNQYAKIEVFGDECVMTADDGSVAVRCPTRYLDFGLADLTDWARHEAKVEGWVKTHGGIEAMYAYLQRQSQRR